MNSRWTRTITAAALSTALALQSLSIAAYADGSQPVAAPPAAIQYPLTQNLNVEIKSVLCEKVDGGTRIAAVIKLENTSGRLARVPDYELRAKTADGVEYTLESSADNVKAVQPRTKAELSYMVTVDREDPVTLSELDWVKIDYYVYPKTETLKLSAPLDSQVWRGEGAVLEQEDALKQWGEAFTIPSTSQPLEYTALYTESEDTELGPVTLVTVQVENKGSRVETVPNLTMEAKAGGKTYQGLLAQNGTELKEGEKKNIYFLIRTDVNVTLDTLHIMTPDSFVAAGGQAVAFTVGRVRLDFPKSGISKWDIVPAYKTGEPMKFYGASDIISDNLKVSMVDFSLNDNQADGYKTAIVKMLFRNEGSSPLKTPNLGLSLISQDGFTYTGTRQSSVDATLMPNLGYVINYSFSVPNTEKGEKLILKAGDVRTAVVPGTQQALSFTVPLTAYQTAVLPYEQDLTALPFYPYTVKIKDWFLHADYSLLSANPYRLKLNLDITKPDNVVAGANAAYMKVELVDASGLTIASQSYPFTGSNALFSGSQVLTVPNLQQQVDYPLTVKIYEAFQTPAGESKHLLATLKQL